MAYLGLLFAVHLSLLIFKSHQTARRLFEPGFLSLFAVVILAWGNLLHTSYIASLVGLLDTPLAYFAISLGVASLLDRVMAYVANGERGVEPHPFENVWAEIRKSPVARVLLTGAGVFTVMAVLIAMAVLANNWDTLAYRFPRVLFYLNGTGLLHPGPELQDARLRFYPYNGSLLYLFLAQYQLTGVTWNFVSVGSWFLSGVAAFYAPLMLGGTIRAAAFSAYALLTTPIVLCLANSTNDEVLAAMPMLLALIFIVHWVRTRFAPAAVLALFAMAISAGTKLHWGFYSPAVLGAGYLLVRAGREESKLLWTSLARRGVLALALAVATPFAVSFLITNYISSGKLTNAKFNAEVVNTPFHPGVGAQTLAIYTAQMLLSPIPDHLRIFGAQKESDLVKTINDTGNRTIFSNVKQGRPYTSTYYRFRGLIDPNAADQFEQTLWLGLVPWLIFGSLAIMLTRRSDYSAPVWFFVLSLPCWHLTFCMLTRYVECVGTYYAYAAPIGIAPVGLLWERFGKSDSAFVRGFSKLFPVLLLSNTLLGATLLFTSTKRDITQAFRITDGETTVSQTDSTLRSVMRGASSVHISYTHYEELFWNLMRLNPAAKYHVSAPKPGQMFDVVLMPRVSAHSWQDVAMIRSDRLGSLKLAGTMSAGETAIFCLGVKCDAECATCPRFLQIPVSYARNGPSLTLRAHGEASGMIPGVAGAFRFTLFNAASQTRAASGWIPVAQLPAFSMSVPDQQFDHLQVEAGCADPAECRAEKTVLALQPGVRYLTTKMPELGPAVTVEEISRVFGPGWEGTEGSGYWKFTWRLRPGTDKLDAVWVGKQGEKINDVMTVTNMTGSEVRILRSTTNSHFIGQWVPGSAVPTAKGYAAWDPTNIWEGRRAGGSTK